MLLETDKLQDKSDLISKLYYSKDKALSYNPYLLATLGGRGVGKTFAYKCHALTTNGQTVWVRRYDSDIEDVCGTNKVPDKFTPDLYEKHKIVPEDNITIDNRTLYIDEYPKIHFIALNTSARKKSASYAGVNTIVFDEFLEMDTSKYLKNETTKFYDLVETISRLRLEELGMNDVRIIMLANKVSFMNPYFADWRVTPFSERFKWFVNGTVLVENYKNELFEQKKAESNFGKLVAGTKYADYAIHNMSWDNDNAYIEKRPKDAEFTCNIRYKDRYIGLWTYRGKMYCSSKHNPQRLTFADTFDCKDKELPIRRTTAPLTWLNNYYNTGALRFDDNIVKQDIFTIMQTGGTVR